ncbi:MAG: MFS transporter [Acidobacteriota bacterium]
MLRSIGWLYAEAFRGLPADVWRLCVGLLINRAGTMVMPFLSLYLVRQLGYETAAASMVLLAFGLGSVAGSYLGGDLSGRVGTVRVQVGSLVLAGATFLLITQLQAFVPMVAACFLAGAINDAYRPACMAAVAEAASPDVRTRAMGLMRLAANGGIAIGPAVGGLLAGIDYSLIFVGEGLTCWVAAVWLARALGGREIRVAEARTEQTAARGPSPWRDGPLMALMGLTFLTALVLFQAFYTLPLFFTSDYGLNERQVGLTFAFNGLMIVVFEMVLIKRLEHLNAAHIVGLGMFLMCGGFGLLPFGHGLGYALFTVAIWTLGEMLAFPFSNVLVAHRAAPGRTAQAMGIYSAMFSIAMVLAPAIGLPMLDRYGGDVLWTACGMVSLPAWILMALLARSMGRTASRAASSQGAIRS